MMLYSTCTVFSDLTKYIIAFVLICFGTKNFQLCNTFCVGSKIFAI